MQLFLMSGVALALAVAVAGMAQAQRKVVRLQTVPIDRRRAYPHRHGGRVLKSDVSYHCTFSLN